LCCCCRWPASWGLNHVVHRPKSSCLLKSNCLQGLWNPRIANSLPKILQLQVSDDFKASIFCSRNCSYPEISLRQWRKFEFPQMRSLGQGEQHTTALESDYIWNNSVLSIWNSYFTNVGPHKWDLLLTLHWPVQTYRGFWLNVHFFSSHL